jgi:hypothetical protein
MKTRARANAGAAVGQARTSGSRSTADMLKGCWGSAPRENDPPPNSPPNPVGRENPPPPTPGGTIPLLLPAIMPASPPMSGTPVRASLPLAAAARLTAAEPAPPPPTPTPTPTLPPPPSPKSDPMEDRRDTGSRKSPWESAPSAACGNRDGTHGMSGPTCRGSCAAAHVPNKDPGGNGDCPPATPATATLVPLEDGALEEAAAATVAAAAGAVPAGAADGAPVARGPAAPLLPGAEPVAPPPCPCPCPWPLPAVDPGLPTLARPLHAPLPPAAVAPRVGNASGACTSTGGGAAAAACPATADRNDGSGAAAAAAALPPGLPAAAPACGRGPMPGGAGPSGSGGCPCTCVGPTVLNAPA